MSFELAQIVFGDRNGDRMIIEVLDRMHPEVEDYWDGNWLVSKIDVVANAWRGAINLGLHLAELSELAEALDDLHKHLGNTVKFDSMERDFSLSLAGDGRGHIAVHIVARDYRSSTEISFK